MLRQTEEEVIKAYGKLTEYPIKVKGIFEDYFGEDKVDLWNLTSYETFRGFLSGTAIADYYIHKIDFSKIEDKERRATLKKELKEGYNAPVTDDFDRARDLLPLLMDNIMGHFTKECQIVVWFPEVTVTNENDRSVDIQDLYIKIPVNMRGELAGLFTANRSTYTQIQFESGYLHSHTPGLNYDSMESFKSVCAGNGPIQSTMTSLFEGFDAGLWQLFCHELEVFTRVESLAGGPYRRLETISYAGNTLMETGFWYSQALTGIQVINCELREFIRWLIQHKSLKFTVTDHGFGIAGDYLSTVMLVSNEFLKFLNTLKAVGIAFADTDFLIRDGVLKRVIINNGKIYEPAKGVRDKAFALEGKVLFDFKGKEVRLHIIKENSEKENGVIILDPKFILYILRTVLEVLNYEYGREVKNCAGRFYV